MPNPRTLLNSHVLKPETVKQVEALGETASQVVDRWAGANPKQLRKLESEGRLLQAVKDQLEQEQKAKDYEAANQWVGGIESRKLFDLSDHPPA